MLMRTTELDPNKYYHCISANKEKNVWLTKGNFAKIFLSNSFGRSSYISNSVTENNDSSILDGSIEWEVREATDEERTWIIQCMYEKRLVPRPMDGIPSPQEVYQIF